MADKPIIFSGPMVNALLAGRKTQTRRILKPQPDFRGGVGDYHDAEEWGWEDEDGYHVSVLDIMPNGFRVGDRLWVRETFSCDGQSDGECLYRATVDEDTGYYAEEIAEIRWRPSIHMPRWASRLTLIVTDVRVQRLQDISEADAVAEGVDAVTTDDVPRQATMSRRSDFAALWNSIHGPKAWDANPWVVALTFTVQRGNIDQIGGAA